MADQNFYVSKCAWLAASGRAELIDDIADQFERPMPASTEVPAAHVQLAGEKIEAVAHWPRTPRSWHPMEHGHHSTIERRIAG